MNWDKAQLLDVLKRASGGLAAKDDLPSFASFFFDGWNVRTYDDQIAVRVPCLFNITGGVPGKTLLAWLNSCSGTEVMVVENKPVSGDLRLRCGNSQMEFATLDLDQYVFRRQEMTGEQVTIPAPFDLIDAISRCEPFMGR